MSFVIADDFNFVLATNNLITLYDVKLNKQKAKTVKQIPIANLTEPVRIFFEPLACTLVAIDSKGSCQPYFLNLYKTKQLKGKLFQLELAQPATGGDSVASSQDLSASNVSADQTSRTSFTQRAVQYFRPT